MIGLNLVVLDKTKSTSPYAELKGVVIRPPLMGVSQPIPEAPDTWIEWNRDEDPRPQRDPRPAKPKVGIKIIENVQIVPPRRNITEAEHYDRPSTPHGEAPVLVSVSQQTQSEESEWILVRDSRTKKKPQQITQQQALQVPQISCSSSGREIKSRDRSRSASRNKERKKIVPRKLPKTAAVAIKGLDKDYSYPEALKRVRENISFAELEIETSRVRKAANGGYLIEIPGEDNAEKAEKLAAKIKEILHEEAVITRPVVKANQSCRF